MPDPQRGEAKAKVSGATITKPTLTAKMSVNI
jgi:hypothetical protein